MLKKILILLVILIAGFGVVVAMQPDEFEVEPTAIIDAPAPAVFEHVNNLQKWNEWSPWARLDANAENSYAGPEAGENAVLRWSGNKDIGVGSMKITESRPSEYVKYKLDFLEPMEGESTAEMKLTPKGDKTNVTWSMSGKHNFIQKAMLLVFNGQKMVGKQFEQGLSNLNTVASQ